MEDKMTKEEIAFRKRLEALPQMTNREAMEIILGMAKEYNIDDGSVHDTAFGIIVGCIYSSFLQIFTNQNSVPNSQDMEEFTEIIIKNSKKIKESIIT